MILLCLLLVCWAKPARGPFSSVFAIPGGGFFLSLLGSSMRLRNPRAFLQPQGSVSVRPHGLITGGVSRSQRGLLLGGAAQMERTPLHTRGWGIFWSGFCLSLSFCSFSAVRWPFRWHSQCLSRPGESSPDYNVRASLLWDLFGSGTQHPHHSGSDHPACCLPLRLLMWLLPADPLYCLGKRAGTSAADRWDSHRTIPRWPKQLCFPGVSKVMTKSITAREACS